MRGSITQSFNAKEQADFIEVFASSAGAPLSDVSIAHLSYLVELPMELAPPSFTASDVEGAFEELLASDPLSFGYNMSVARGPHSSTPSTSTLSVKINSRHRRVLLQTASFNVEFKAASVEDANAIVLHFARPDWTTDLRDSGLEVAGAALVDNPEPELVIEVMTTFDGDAEAQEAAIALQEAADNGSFANRLAARTGYGVDSLESHNVVVVLPPPMPPLPGAATTTTTTTTTAASTGGSGDSTTNTTSTSSDPTTSTTTVDTMAAAREAAKDWIEDNLDLVIYGGAAAGFLFACLIFYCVYRCCCKSRGAGKGWGKNRNPEMSRLKAKHLSERGGSFRQERKQKVRGGVYAPTENVLHNNWAGDGDGNAMDDFSARSPEGYINNDMRGPRGRTPPSSQRSRAAPRGFGGGARRSSIALGNEGNQARYAQFLYD